MNDTKEKLKGAEEILQELIAEAKEGRCKDCQWCFPHKEWDDEFDPTEAIHKISHICLMGEGDGWGDDAPHFTPDQLDDYQYPERCNLGAFIDDDGVSIPYCLAFTQNLDQVIMVMASGGDYRHEAIQPEIARHSLFMSRLSEAANLEDNIKKGKLEKLLNILSGVTSDPLLLK